MLGLAKRLELRRRERSPQPRLRRHARRQLYDELLAHRLPARPTTQAEALSRVEAAFYAVKLAQEHHLPLCIETLGAICPPSITREPEDDPVAAAAEHLAKTDLLDDPSTGEPLQADVYKAREYLEGACTLVSLVVSHMDLAVAALSSFLDPKQEDFLLFD